MDEAELEQAAKETREKLLRLWDGDAKQADKWMCFIIRYYKDNSGDVPTEDKERALKLMMQLLQR